MARDRLNFFRPFERLPPNHENQLTRALLVVLRLSPLAHAVWLRYVAPDRQLEQLPPAEFDTQRRDVRRAKPDDEPVELISVFLAPEEPLGEHVGVVTEDDRRQVLDAIIDYGGELVVVVETKAVAADATQAVLVNTSGARVVIDGRPVVIVKWRDLLDAFIAFQERDLVGGAEKGVLDDFLTYVDHHFPRLGPYRTLRLCQGVEFRQTRRLRQMLAEATGNDASSGVYGQYISVTEDEAADAILRDVYLNMRGSEIELSLFPADTLTQARNFYTDASAVQSLRRLVADEGWQVVPNFHFGHMQRGYCWTCNQIDMDDYIHIWERRIATETQVPRKDWESYWAWLESKQIACADDRPEFDRRFRNTMRQRASPRPGVKLSRRWSLTDAEALDDTGEFTAEVGDALNQALAELRVPPLNRATVGERDSFD